LKNERSFWRGDFLAALHVRLCLPDGELYEAGRFAEVVSYCKIAPGHPLHGPYHDREYGFPVSDEAPLFERLVLEINQAGLSWTTILAKRQNFQVAYDDFNVDRVAAYGASERNRLLNDALHRPQSIED
jgi:hypothetical protein